MSKKQTFRSEDNAFCLEKTAAVSAARNDVKQMEQRAGAKKDFETEHSGVFAAPGLPLAQF